MEDKITVTVIATGFVDDTEPPESETQEQAGDAVSASPKPEASHSAFLQNDFISSSEWARLQTPKQPALPGLGPRNAGAQASFAAEPEKVEKPRGPIHVQLPGANTDLDIPAYVRNKK